MMFFAVNDCIQSSICLLLPTFIINYFFNPNMTTPSVTINNMEWLQAMFIELTNESKTPTERAQTLSNVKALQPREISEFVSIIAHHLQTTPYVERCVLRNLLAGIIIHYIVEHNACGQLVPHYPSLSPPGKYSIDLLEEHANLIKCHDV
jgi:hypothetical protein